MTKKNLRRRLKTAKKRVKKERLIVSRAKDRLYYWENIRRNIEYRLELANEGQIELPI